MKKMAKGSWVNEGGTKFHMILGLYAFVLQKRFTDDKALFGPVFQLEPFIQNKMNILITRKGFTLVILKYN